MKLPNCIIMRGIFTGTEGWPSEWHVDRTLQQNKDSACLDLRINGKVYVDGEYNLELTDERRSVMKLARRGYFTLDMGDEGE